MTKLDKDILSNSLGQHLFENNPIAHLLISKYGKLEASNKRACQLIGVSQEELENQPVLEFFDRAQKILVRTILKDLVANEISSNRTIDLKLASQNGSVNTVTVSGERLMLNGEIKILLKMVEYNQNSNNQSSESKLTSAAVQPNSIGNSQELYKIVARNFPNGVISVFDENFNYLFAEGKELYRMGITSERLVGTNYLTRLPGALKEEVRAKLMDVLDGKNQTFEVSFKNNHYILNATGLEGENSQINKILLVEINITQQKKAEEEIKRAFEKERQLNELKSRFVAMASHEFRTPLSTILSSTNLILKYLEMPDTREKIVKHGEKVMTSVKNLTRILNDFLSIDKLDEGKMELHPTKFDLCEMVKTMVESVEDSLKEGQEFQLILPNVLIVKQDPNVFRNILLNLLTNAIKYSLEHQEIVIKVWSIKNKVVLEVQDEGIGIPEEEQGQLFERFFRAKNAFNLQGTGLGLNIVQKYVSLINGKISFISKEQEGTTFTISFPKTHKNEESISH